MKEIIDYYAEIDIEIRASDIVKPTMASTLRLFDMLLELYKGERTSDLLGKHRNAEDFAEFEDALYITSVYRRMSGFLEKIGIQTFSLRNITHPEHKKLISILSVIVNFSMYRDNKRDLYERVSKAIDERERMRRDVVDKITSAQEDIRELEAKVVSNERAREDLVREVEQLESELRESYKVIRVKTSDLEKIKEEKAGLYDSLSSLQLHALNAKQEIACLKTQLVSDPEKLLDLLGEMKHMISKEKESIGILKERKRDISGKVGIFEDAVERMKVLNKVAVSLQKEERDVEEVQKRNRDLEAGVKDDEATINTLKIKLGHINRQISHLESKVLSLQDSEKKCAEEVAGELESLKINYEKISEERSMINSKALENMKEYKKIEFETFRLRSTHENELADVRCKLCELKDAVFRYTGSLKQYLEQ